MDRGILVLSNDPELAVFLRDWFPHAFILHHAQNANTTTPRFRKRFAKSVNIATACSDYAARWNEQYFNLAPHSITTIYNGADTDAYLPRQDWAADKPTINFVGKTDPIKGPDILLKAALILARRTTAFRIQIVGRKYYDRDAQDAYQTELAALAQQLTAAGIDVRFTGWIDRRHLPETLGQAHIHVVPSRWDEPSALTIYEGMSCGMATIGSRTGGTPEIIADSGFLFDRDNPHHLADLLEPLVRNRSLCRSFGEKARARALELSWAACWKKLKSLLPLTAPALAEPRPQLVAAAVS
ncbi:MAG TPA: glycosyltransferase family 4 protein [Phycisphaerae bacterium]|nr:glycosyltransferase family 4 protein [Phycisphaerae bacterium]